MALDKEQLVAALRAKGVKATCPMCAHNSWSTLDGYFAHSISSDLQNVQIGANMVPIVAIGCDNCGFLSQHVAATLNLA
ncbi:hypothetical protein [Nocardioides sp. SYSU DS0663]|uniref:hypothetical protein n=1 Tax=Nocardioides sp. SYSU DS0663 TaxID=3416445 RepID=UPI003F4BD612